MHVTLYECYCKVWYGINDMFFFLLHENHQIQFFFTPLLLSKKHFE